MEGKMKCPICGKENKRIYYDEDIGLVEDYYSCDNCGYNLEMCYSPAHEYINLDRWNMDKLKELWNKDNDKKQHGYWFYIGAEDFSWLNYKCSNCGYEGIDEDVCPICGAIMDGDGEV